jgi:hypothetical protein
MSTGQPPGDDPTGAGRQPSEEELRAAYEAELKKIKVEHIVLEQVVSLINLGMRRTGLAPGTEDERDVDQVRLAIEAVRVLLPLVEQAAGPQAGSLRDALSQLQLAYVRLGGGPAPAGQAQPAAPQAQPAAPQDPGAGPGEGLEGGDEADGPPSGGAPESEPAKPGEAGPAQRSGRLWVPGQ